ncbi:hypothetical protein BD413DRAFT_116175 [Trametes elegans]|nr:hypothetical protein BD413DRAFT_116175 [Trametes elegans]
MAAFTVKATYRNETRKLSFPDPLFPTYDQLYSQLYRVFPISHSFYLSKLLLSLDGSSTCILIGKEVHSAEEYGRHVAPYRGRLRPGALLRFSVFDETPHKSPRMASSLSLAESSPPSTSSDIRASVANPLDGASQCSTATVVEPAADAHTSLRGSRRVLLERLRERTSNRAGLNQDHVPMPPTPPRSSRPTSMAESTSRPVSFLEDLPSWVAPVLPPSRDATASAASTASTRTARPSLFDLLGNTSQQASETQPVQEQRRETVPQAPGRSPTREPRDASSRPSSDILMADSLATLGPTSESVTLNPLRSDNPPSPRLPSINELSLPPACNFVAPPPPILYPTHDSPYIRRNEREPGEGSPVARHRSYIHRVKRAQSAPQQAQAPQCGPRDTVRATAQSSVRPDNSGEDCCSISRTKEEIKELMEQFKGDFEQKMIKAFGEDWDKDERLPHLPSPPTHHPAIPNPPGPARPSRSYWPPPPPPPYFVPPPPPLFGCVPPPPSHALYMAPPPPPRMPPPPIAPPPPMPVPHSIRAGHAFGTDRRGIPSPPPIPHVAYNPTRGPIKLEDTPRVECRNSEDNVHKAVKCDNCHKRNIRGIRYKCLECADHDLCESCMASPSAWENHDRTHAFFPIHKATDFVDFCVVKEKRQQGQPRHKGTTCDGCNEKNIIGVRHKCLQCEDYDLCSACISSPSTRQKHTVSHVFFPIVQPGKKDAYTEARNRLQGFPPSSSSAPACHLNITCDGCRKSPIAGIRHKCLDCEDYDLCSNCFTSPEHRLKHNVLHAFYPVGVPGELAGYRVAAARHNHPLFGRGNLQTARERGLPNAVPAPPAAVVHKNIICDICDCEIVGVRHKCLDCPDFDLCQTCIDTPSLRSQHYSGHEFFAIEKPGEVIVHTVFSGDGEREPERPQSPTRGGTVRSRPRDVEPVVHNATCNLCDSRIRGDRFKCLDCPDYDLCQLCYKCVGQVRIGISRADHLLRIVNEQHPNHGFVKVGEPAILMVRNRANDPVHYASCNVCGNRIVGVRYKCMHDTCDDFDLCETCEAMPIPVHPFTHPLLKMKTAETRVPEAFTPAMRRSSPVPTDDPFDDAHAFEHAHPRVPERSETPEEPHRIRVIAPPPPQVRPLPQITPDMESARRLSMTPTPPFRESCGFSSTIEVIPRCSPPSTGPPSVASLSRPMSPDRYHRMLVRLPSRGPTPVYEQPSPQGNDVAEVVSASPESASASVPGLFDRVISISEEVAPPEVRLIDLDEPVTPREERSAPVEAEANHDGFATLSEVPISTPGSNFVPRLASVNNEWQELWPEVTSLLKHLLQPPTPSAAAHPAGEASGSSLAMPGAMIVDDNKVEEPKPAVTQEGEAPAATEESPSPLVGEPLLCRPLMPERPLNPFTSGRRLSDLILGVPPVRTAARSVRESLDRFVTPVPALSPSPVPLLASFVSDNNIADGQIFPPGAEFVKSWRMRNYGEVDWPESTELIFVAGDRMAPRDAAVQKVHVGAVKAGEEVEVVAGEMKAPEIPGKYVSSWRLSDGNGNLFGHSVWVDITVAEMNESSSESLASSSVIMPQTAPQPSSATRSAAEHVFAHLTTPSATLPSSPLSEGGSSVSLIDMPDSVSSSDDDDAMYEDSRSRVLVSPRLAARDVEYVMLFDSSSEDD